MIAELRRRALGPLRWGRAVLENRARARRDQTAGLPRVPIILISSTRNVREAGDRRFNGGLKLYNVWVKLLRENGYPAYIVTWDGTAAPWLIEQQPVISMATARRWRRAGLPLKFVTGWAQATAFIRLADRLYFYDCELAYSSERHLPLLRGLMAGKVERLATNSRHQQGFFMTTFDRPVPVVRQWSDGAYWRPEPAVRETGRVGYMDEGPSTATDISRIAELCRAAGVDVRFERIEGDEVDVVAGMQRSDIYLGMNPGKHPLWGEGSPVTQLEALHCGCVLVAYDVNGNREYLLDGYSGFLVPRGRPEAMARQVIDLMRDGKLRERIRSQSTALVAGAFTAADRWPEIRDFLDLDDLPEDARATPSELDRTAIEARLEDPAYLADDEIALLRKSVASAGRMVEIGAAFGASSFVLLDGSPSSSRLTSLDPFVRDSMGDFRASASRCRGNVARALARTGRLRRLGSWTLRLERSEQAARSWQEPIDFLFIDGDHRYDAVRRDFDDWVGFVQAGGLIALHDSRRLADAPQGEFARGWPGPTRLAAELAASDLVELVDEAFSLTLWRRTAVAAPGTTTGA